MRPPSTTPDASMSLLREAVDRAVDPAYALAAARATDGRRSHRRSTRAAVALLAAVLGAGTTTAVVSLRAPAPAGARQALLDEIAARTAVADAAAARVADLRADVDARTPAPSGGAGGDLAAATATASTLAATSPARGAGLRLVLDDAAGARTAAPGTDPRSGAPAASGLVLDRDLQVVVNGLFAAGACAVAVNDHRLTSLTSIRVAGAAILVDYQPLTPPYRVEAVGDPRPMAAAFADSAAGDYLAALARSYGVAVTSTVQPDLDLPAGTAPTLRHASAAPAPGQRP